MSSTSIQNLLDSMQTLLKHQEGAVDQLSSAASEARQGNERWRIERQVLAGQIITAKCPNLVHSLPLLTEAGTLHADVLEQLKLVSSAMTLTTAEELCARTKKSLTKHHEMVKALEALPDLNVVQSAFSTVKQRMFDEKNTLKKLQERAAEKSSPWGALSSQFAGTPWLTRFHRNVVDACKNSNGLTKAVQKSEEALQELSNWTLPKPWYLRFFGVGAEGHEAAKRVKHLEQNTHKPIAVLVQEAGQQLATQTLQEIRLGEVSQLAAESQQHVNYIEEQLNRALPNRKPNQPWQEALPTAADWRKTLYKEVFDLLLQQEPLSQVARRAGLNELVDPLEQAEAKRDVMSRIVDATEDALRTRRNDVSQTSSQVKKIEKAARKRPSQSVSIDLNKIKAAGPQIASAAKSWKKEVSRLNSSVSNAPRTRDTVSLPATSSSFSSSNSASTASSGMTFWDFYLWNTLLNGNAFGGSDPSPLTGQVLNLDSSDVKSFAEAGVDVSSVGKSLESFDSGVNGLNFSDTSTSVGLGADSWSSIDSTLSSVTSAVESTSFSSCSSSSYSSSSSCSSSSCSSSSSSSSSCGGGGGD